MELVWKQGEHELEQVTAAIVKKVATDKNRKLDDEIKLKQLNGGQKLRVKIDPKASTNYKKERNPSGGEKNRKNKEDYKSE